MDAMSHWGVARDVCAYLSHHDKKGIKAKLPTSNYLKPIIIRFRLKSK
jgi:phenylalanyl-tRNA synthetase beta chain